MRIRISTLVMAAMAAVSAYAQETAPVDSLKESKELQEVVVVGANQSAKPGELTFIPTDRQKKASADGYELLRHIAMPQILVNPASDNVTTLAGGGVSMFINGMPASDIDIKNLRTKNVVRIEYLEFPSDTRFGGAQHVLNYIVQLPEWGGYTRLSAGTHLLSNFASNANLFSKFIYKKMNYDLYLGWRYSNLHHSGYEKKDLYSLLTENGDSYCVEQIQNTNYTRQRGWGLPINFRATYNTDNFQAQNTVSFSYSDTPENTEKGSLQATNIENSDMSFRNFNSTQLKKISWSGNFNLYLNHGLSFRLWSSVQYNKNKDNRQYENNSFSSGTNIKTDSNEDAWYGGINLKANKRLNGSHTISVDYFANINNYDIKYTGTSPFDIRMRDTNLGGGIAYYGNFPFNLRLHASAGYGWSRSHTGDQTNCKGYVGFNADASYSPNSAHQLNLWIRLSSSTPSASNKTDDVLRRNEFLYITGYPGLKDYYLYSTSLSYTWFTNYKLNFTAFANIATSFNKVAPYYLHYQNGQAILQSYHNSGDYYTGQFGIKAVYRPIRSLQFDVMGAYQPAKITGELHRSIHPFSGQINTSFYAGEFSFTLSGGLGSRSLGSIDGALMRYKPYYLLRGGWNHGNWNIQIYANNIFNSSWKSVKSEMIYPLYGQFMTSYDGSFRRALSVNVSYTFDYGKKVKHESEIEADENNNSAILK